MAAGAPALPGAGAPFAWIYPMRVWLVGLVIALELASGAAGHAASAPDIAPLVQGLSGQDAVILGFYRQRNFAPAWSNEDAATLTDTLRHAAQEGLEAKTYQPMAGEGAAGRDIGLTRAALDYLRDVRIGRSALRTLDPDVGLPASVFDAAAGLNGAIQAHKLAAYLREAPPPGPQYALLRSALATYRAIGERGGWPEVSAADALSWLVDGQASARLRERLAFEDPALASDPVADLPSAVKRFQRRHGLEPDGVLGRQTLAALNVPAQARAEQVIANMERWRWLPRSFEADYLAVNVADASLSLILGGQEVLSSRVVVGKPKTPTPILRAEGGGITVNPPWNVPLSIARKEILPKLKANPSYLRSQDMVLLNGPPGDPYGLHIRWRDIRADNFPYLIQQHPGAGNALGTIKLELPNRFDVYLHDTPAKNAFARTSRDISHGCVRVERILPLASYMLTQNLDSMVTVANAVSTGETRFFPLYRRVPVYFLYWTAFAGPDGVMQFRPDLYGRDARLLAALSQPLTVAANFPSCTRG